MYAGNYQEIRIFNNRKISKIQFQPGRQFLEEVEPKNLSPKKMLDLDA